VCWVLGVGWACATFLLACGSLPISRFGCDGRELTGMAHCGRVERSSRSSSSSRSSASSSSSSSSSRQQQQRSSSSSAPVLLPCFFVYTYEYRFVSFRSLSAPTRRRHSLDSTHSLLDWRLCFRSKISARACPCQYDKRRNQSAAPLAACTTRLIVHTFRRRRQCILGLGVAHHIQIRSPFIHRSNTTTRLTNGRLGSSRDLPRRSNKLRWEWYRIGRFWPRERRARWLIPPMIATRATGCLVDHSINLSRRFWAMLRRTKTTH